LVRQPKTAVFFAKIAKPPRRQSVNKWTTIVMQQSKLTTPLLSGQTTNHHFKVFVKCWSSASVTCMPYPQTSMLQKLGM